MLLSWSDMPPSTDAVRILIVATEAADLADRLEAP
jgi:hypothetical protein